MSLSHTVVERNTDHATMDTWWMIYKITLSSLVGQECGSSGVFVVDFVEKKIQSKLLTQVCFSVWL
jgi:hypothetical protein